MKPKPGDPYSKYGGSIFSPTPSPGNVDELIQQAAQRHQVPESWIRATIQTESTGNPNAWRPEPEYGRRYNVPNAGSRGLMQIMPLTARSLGLQGDLNQLYDPATNIDLGTKYLAQLRDRHGNDFQRIYSAYNSGDPDAYRKKGDVAAHTLNAMNNLKAVSGDPYAVYGGSAMAPAAPPLEQRQELSRQQFESNQPESTLASRTLAAAEGLGFEPRPTVLGTVGATVGKIGEAALNLGKLGIPGLVPTRDVVGAAGQIAKGMVTAPVEGPWNIAAGAAAGDWDRAARGAGQFASQTVPAIEGGVKAGKGVYAAGLSATTRNPISTLMDAFKVGRSDLRFAENAPLAMDEMKAYQRAGGKLDKVEDWLKGVEIRSRAAEGEFQKLLTPQRDIDISQHRHALIESQRKAIPSGITAEEQASLERYIEERTPKKLTIGTVDALRSSMGARSRGYGLKASKGIAFDESRAAIDQALGDASRNLTYDSMDANLGGGQAARDLGKRKGALIHLEDQLQGNKNRILAERKSLATEKTQKIRQVVARPFKTLAEGLEYSTEELLQRALKDWKTEAKPVATTLRQPQPDLGLPRRVRPTPPPTSPTPGATVAEREAVDIRPAPGAGQPYQAPAKQKVIPPSSVQLPQPEPVLGEPYKVPSKQPVKPPPGIEPLPNRPLTFEEFQEQERLKRRGHRK